MEDIEAEIEEKIIEKINPSPAPQGAEPAAEELKPVRKKKPRTEAQKAAFEKARAKRLDNLKKKKEGLVEDKPVSVDEEVKPETTPPAPKKRGRPRGSKVKQAERHLPEPVNHPAYQPVNHNIPFNQGAPQNYYHYDPRFTQPPQQPQQPVNNYYYYGAPPPHAPAEPQQVKQVELIEDSSEEEQDNFGREPDPRLYVEEEYPVEEPKLQFRFA